MTFLSPEWMFLIPALAALAWIRPGLRLHTPLRAVILLILVLAMTRPVISTGGSGRDIWLLVDQSDSLAGQAASAEPEVEEILRRGQGKHDQIYLVDYGRDSGRRDKGDPVFTGGTKESRLGSAIENTLAQADSKRDTRFIVLTDGYSTEPLGDAGEKLLKSGVRLDYRLMGATLKDDTRVADLHTPTRVLPGQAFLIEFTIRGLAGKIVPWELRQGEKVLSGVAELHNGQAHVRLTDRLIQPGSAEYRISIFPEKDEVPQNNHAGSFVEVAGGSDILLASAYDNDPIADILRAQGFTVHLVTETERLTVRNLTGTKLVLMNNVPAAKLGGDFLKGLDFFVREQSGGLAMIGGKYSFNSGGYHSTPVEDLLPVSMEMKKDHRQMVTAISYVLDRSGSMSIMTSSGMSKMELADRGTVSALELMLPQDYVSVHAVDSSAHQIVKMSQIDNNVAKLADVVLKIESMGGGIFVYEGMAAGWKELQRIPAATKHMVLFSDANDSEEPGDYKKLIAEMKAAEATVSVIALGSPSDCDADLLREIAFLGGGRIYFSESGLDLPSLFSQETALVARSAFIKESTPLISTPGWLQIAANSMEWPEKVDGYNLCYLREGAMAAAVSKDEYSAPLTAFWPRGAGRVAAVTFPMGGEYSGTVRAWPKYGDFTQTLARWLIGAGEPEGYSLRTRLDGDQLTLELLYADSRIADIAKNPPEAKMEFWEGSEKKMVTPVWEKIEPGRFVTTQRLTADSLARGVVKIGEAHLPFGPVTLSSDLEWAMDSRRVAELKQLSALSGGAEMIDFASVWKDPVKKSELSLLPYLLIFGLVLLLMDAFLTRYGLMLTFRGWEKR